MTNGRRLAIMHTNDSKSGNRGHGLLEDLL